MNFFYFYFYFCYTILTILLIDSIIMDERSYIMGRYKQICINILAMPGLAFMYKHKHLMIPIASQLSNPMFRRIGSYDNVKLGVCQSSHYTNNRENCVLPCY